MTPLLFRKKVLDFYRRQGRDFLWRRTSDPYKILVSEMMLQQTQTFRVEPKYAQFLKEFPTARMLAKAPLAKVLRAWQGLGYNRRALYLQKTAQAAVTRYNGKLPTRYEQLIALPGIGPYTASAVLAFAYNQPVVMIETNIRAALIHEFFPRARRVTDARLLPLLTKAVPEKNARQFYQALMDYGAFIKQRYPNPSRRSAHHIKQSVFAGSDRQMRGQIVRTLTQRGACRVEELQQGETARFQRVMQGLVRDGLVRFARGRYAIAV